VKTTQYVKQERAIAAADSGGVRERWMWGLRLLRDPEAFAPGSSQLRPGLADELIDANAKRGIKLSEREIRRRLQCARTYQTETEFGHAVAEFGTWRDLADANFPAREASPDEPPADHRTPDEIRRDRARQLAEAVDPQGVLFPLDRFEPATVTLMDLETYTKEQEELTARFAAHDWKRRCYLARLIEAAGGDLSTTWQQAHELLPPLPEEEAG
jgi:hypothetical protein